MSRETQAEPQPPPLPPDIRTECSPSCGFECSPNMSLLLPGFWHLFHGHAQRGIAWMLIVVVTSPLIVPAVVAWLLCWFEALRWHSRDHATQLLRTSATR